MRRFLEAALIVVVTFGWWGFIYPELSMVMESCVQEAEAEVQETETETQGSEAAIQGEEAKAPAEKTFRQGKADPAAKFREELGSGIVRGNFCIKSRIAEYLYQGKEKDKAEKESGYEQPKCTYRGV